MSFRSMLTPAIAALSLLSLLSCGTTRFNADNPPAPPAAWLAPCPGVALLDEGRAITPQEAWGAVFGEGGLIEARRCERERRACVARWYAERLWSRPPEEARCSAT